MSIGDTDTMLVVPAPAGAALAGTVAAEAERAAEVARCRVTTLLVDTSPDGDIRTQSAFFSGLGASKRLFDPLPGAGWAAAVARGLRHAQRAGAETVIVVDPGVVGGQGDGDGWTTLTGAVGLLRRQVSPGVVCVPAMAPWWERLLAAHLVRPLLGLVLGFEPVDPAMRTLVLSAEAVQAVLDRSSPPGTSWECANGLHVVGAARHRLLSVSQSASWGPGAASREDYDSLLPAALRLAAAPVAPGLATTRAPVHDLVPSAGSRLPESAAAALTTLAGYRPVGSAPASWPDPLVAAWHHARTPGADAQAIAAALKPSAMQWLALWLRTTNPVEAGFTRARAEIGERTRAFQDATRFGA